MKIDIVTDGNNELGMGHVYQVITLVRYLLNENPKLNIQLYTKSDQAVVKLLRTTNCKVIICVSDCDLYDYLEERKSNSIIFDKLNVSPILAKKIKENINSKLFIFTNLTAANDYADVTLMAGISDNFQNLCRVEEITGKVEFFGPKYWILRPEFLELREASRTIRLVKKVLLIFGGSDPSNFSSKVLENLFEIQTQFNISLVLGVGFNHNEELKEVIQANTSLSKVDVFRSVDNIAEMMVQSDVVFASPGLTYFESLAVGTPVLGFHQNKMQEEVFDKHLPTLGLDDLSKLIGIIENRSFVFPCDSFIKNMEIGQGIKEIIDQILNVS
ncbi:probable pore coat polysaccharide biosynthesis protein [Oleispira antarctica RB-8]|uniref:Probable pore coat polysaccharide biosynthesis protein n=1 Tax=Oleispira antarctica RB-8 TaxID=698738 RepID=R4YLF7_OLEAN|nr:probable pore coat polysaccharide biosynthesis protein [Oleispira antarctica RB-8]